MLFYNNIESPIKNEVREKVEIEFGKIHLHLDSVNSSAVAEHIPFI